MVEAKLVAMYKAGLVTKPNVERNADPNQTPSEMPMPNQIPIKASSEMPMPNQIPIKASSEIPNCNLMSYRIKK
jgi:hypothetical protein